MNCKPGDWAMYVGSEYSHAQGQIFRCVRSWTDTRGRLAWVTEPPPPIQNAGGRCFIDAVLRPIRDPGSQAVDEMVHFAGKPTHTPTPERKA